MIYDQPAMDAAIDQGDLIEGCPTLRLKAVPTGTSALEPVALDWRRVVVLTQTCDLANGKTVDANVAEVFDAQLLAESGVSVEAASRIRAMPTRWLVQDVVPDEAVTIIGGAAGAGKSFFACQLAADVARQLRGRVVFATAGYERPELLRWRLDQADGDARRIAIATLTPPKGFFDQRRKPGEDEIDERMSILYYTIEGAADPESGILPREGSGSYTQRVPGVQGSEEEQRRQARRSGRRRDRVKERRREGGGHGDKGTRRHGDKEGVDSGQWIVNSRTRVGRLRRNGRLSLAQTALTPALSQRERE